ncbi:J domain-containing protein [Mameliella sediminis]|uniref:J domain-containing protein n=1 Tax=Mameliella sediminis TaxID=2836866 RepID=UPI001C487FDA|nr:J domain-containing protein [Mameliella sediminis]MBY6113038.1 J domain-containing protein [Antarctobacter heliothermus]MBY6143614.1 J domain-containing protein [Mameliella alba]MBV7394320.1 J domain-containing protein [Mameliella sediminis]MBY6162268.1 J domain-containing protein [Mameliella alba]MBY6170742.1 J domain-containing protein [Mameliella alba]
MTRIAPQTAYAVLGVTHEDDFATVRRAWIRLVKANHPDALGGDVETATRRLARINEAYDALCWHNPEKLRIHKERALNKRREEMKRQLRASRTLRAAPRPAQPDETPKQVAPAWDGKERRKPQRIQPPAKPSRSGAAICAQCGYHEGIAATERDPRFAGVQLARSV